MFGCSFVLVTCATILLYSVMTSVTVALTGVGESVLAEVDEAGTDPGRRRRYRTGI